MALEFKTRQQLSHQEQQALAKIARETEIFEDLTPRNSDRLDFKEVSKWQIEEALARAYHFGLSAAQQS